MPSCFSALFDLFEIACLKIDWLLPQTILLVAFNYFDKPQSICLKYYFKILHKGAKQTFMYLFLSLKNYFISLFEKWHFNKPHVFI